MADLGLTGGIGSGKSTVAKMLAEHGATIIDADAISRQLMEPGQEVLAETVATFGDHLLDAQGKLDRAALASVVFGDKEALEKLNAIVHPAVRAESERLRQEAITAQGEGAIIIQDIPLLTESGQADRFDGVILVDAPEEVRVKRLVEHRGMDAEDARARMNNQATDEQRRAIATWIIDNSGTIESTRHQVDQLWNDIIERYHR